MVPLNPRPEELELLKARLDEMQAAERAAKKEKKRAKAAANGSKRESIDDGAVASKKRPASSDGNNQSAVKKQVTVAATAVALPKILAAKETSDAIKSLYSSNQKPDAEKGNWLTRGTFTRYVA